MPSLPSRLFFALALAAVPLACGPTYVPDDSGGGDGSDDAGTGGEPSSDGNPETGGASSTGGTASETGGETGSGGESNTDCEVAEDCALAADLDDECFTPYCSHPVAVTQTQVDDETCLVPWDERMGNIPEECAAHDTNRPCPESCAVPLSCPKAECDDGVCVVTSDDSVCVD